MGILDLFRRLKIKFGLYGEDISYHLPDKEIYISYSYLTGPRLYSESINKWRDGPILTEAEKQTVFNDVLRFLSKAGKKPIVIINTDDASKNLWLRLCATNQSAIEGIEYTSDEERYQFKRQMCLDTIKAGGHLEVKGKRIRTEQELDEVLPKSRK